MSDSGLTVPGMTEQPRCYDVTITVDRTAATTRTLPTLSVSLKASLCGRYHGR